VRKNTETISSSSRSKCLQSPQTSKTKQRIDQHDIRKQNKNESNDNTGHNNNNKKHRERSHTTTIISSQSKNKTKKIENTPQTFGLTSQLSNLTSLNDNSDDDNNDKSDNIEGNIDNISVKQSTSTVLTVYKHKIVDDKNNKTIDSSNDVNDNDFLKNGNQS